ncbi:MAG: DUF5615 family PIN-like protein [Cyanobacteria bacterium J06629_19]
MTIGMFRLYTNKNLAAELVEALRGLGYDVLTSYEAGNANQGIPDEQVLADATADQRCVVTFNRDDFAALQRNGAQHEGIVVCKDDPERKQMALVLHDYLTQQKTLRNRLIRVLKKNQPGKAGPVFFVREYSR